MANRAAYGSLCSDLRERGVRTLLLSGDAAGPTEFIAGAIGADDWTAEATPAGAGAALHSGRACKLSRENWLVRWTRIALSGIAIRSDSHPPPS